VTHVGVERAVEDALLCHLSRQDDGADLLALQDALQRGGIERAVPDLGQERAVPGGQDRLHKVGPAAVQRAVDEIPIRGREVAVLLGVSEEEAIEVIGAAEAYRPMSLDAPVTDEEGGETLGDLIGDHDPELETVVDHNAVRPLIEKLPGRERTILLYRFFGNKTQTGIAELMQISQMHVSRLISRSLVSLKAELLKDG
jgi:DNA-directed RNA polymerase specialized sigma24 family protein